MLQFYVVFVRPHLNYNILCNFGHDNILYSEHELFGKFSEDDKINSPAFGNFPVEALEILLSRYMYFICEQMNVSEVIGTCNNGVSGQI